MVVVVEVEVNILAHEFHQAARHLIYNHKTALTSPFYLRYKHNAYFARIRANDNGGGAKTNPSIENGNFPEVNVTKMNTQTFVYHGYTPMPQVP